MEQPTSLNTEQAILEAAERLFTEKGFALTSTTEIARAVGCNQAMVHYYFRTKDKLFAAIFEKKARILISNFMRQDIANFTIEEKIVAFIGSHFDVLQSNPRLPFFVINELNTNSLRIEIVREIFNSLPRNLYSDVENALQQAIRAGVVRQMEMLDLVITIISLNAGLFLLRPIVQHLSGMSDPEISGFVNNRRAEHIKIVLAALRP
jgi:AcrR family transcriptional regulator